MLVFMGMPSSTRRSKVAKIRRARNSWARDFQRIDRVLPEPLTWHEYLTWRGKGKGKDALGKGKGKDALGKGKGKGKDATRGGGAPTTDATPPSDEDASDEN